MITWVGINENGLSVRSQHDELDVTLRSLTIMSPEYHVQLNIHGAYNIEETDGKYVIKCFPRDRQDSFSVKRLPGKFYIKGHSDSTPLLKKETVLPRIFPVFKEMGGWVSVCIEKNKEPLFTVH